MKIPFKLLYDRIYPSQEEQEQITKFIQDCVDNWHTRFKENRSIWWGRKIMKFFMLPKTELHKQFKDIIVATEREDRIKRQTYEKKREMQDNIDRLTNQFPDDSFQYEYLNKFDVDDDHIIRITIPLSQQGKIKNYATMLISQKETPNLYIMFM